MNNTALIAEVKGWRGSGGTNFNAMLERVIDALEAAQAGEPVAMAEASGEIVWIADEYPLEDTNLYTHPAPQVPMTNAAQLLCKFYGVDTYPALVEAQARHIAKLQAKLPNTIGVFKPQKVRFT